MMDAPCRPERLDDAVDHYVAARLEYSPRLIAWLARETGIAGQRLLDPGCEPGFIANAIARLVDDVLGLDPSPRMIAAARASAAPNARFDIGSSEDLGAVGAPVRLVTMGRAFQWMDRARMLSDLDPPIVAGGAIALLNEKPADLPANRWWRDVDAVARNHAVPDDYNRYRASEAWLPHEAVLAGSAFDDIRAISLLQAHEWSFERPVLHTLSRSSTTEALLGARRAGMETDMRAALAPYGPGPWTSLNLNIALIARRSADDPPDRGRHG